MENLAKAIINVMREVSNIEKSMTVGSGNNSYKGVSDKDVKHIIGSAMEKNGLCIMPIDVQAKSQVDRWEETSQYGVKTKQSVFVEVTSKYLLLHESGESQVIAGYGHGVDSQDKSAGKATTYSLKNALLYTFMVPTGEIDDTDKTHSDTIPVPAKNVAKAEPKPAITAHPILLKGTDKWNTIVEALANGVATLDKVKAKNTVTPEIEKELAKAVKLIQAERLQKAS